MHLRHSLHLAPLSLISPTTVAVLIAQATPACLLDSVSSVAHRFLKQFKWRSTVTISFTERNFEKCLLFSWYSSLRYRAHSFPRTAEFRAEPRNLGFPRVLSRGIHRGLRQIPRYFRGFDVFHSNNYFSQKMT